MEDEIKSEFESINRRLQVLEARGESINRRLQFIEQEIEILQLYRDINNLRN